MNKKPNDDDGRTIANMNIEGMPWYYPEKSDKYDIDEGFSKKEIIIMIKQAYLKILPMVFGLVAVYVLVLLLIKYLWLKA